MNGEWKMLKTRKYMPVSDSSTGELIAEVPCCTLDEVDSVVQAAHQAFPAWSV
jgi:malonate-semialdehyde dehydrogenase (acetylating)/methylmalonate-semialdehyde dehydrogenase